MEIVAGIALIGVMLLIGSDIVGRIFGYPVPGTYEIVSLAGGLIVGLALPATSRTKGHVSTDFLLEKLSERSRLLLDRFNALHRHRSISACRLGHDHDGRSSEGCRAK